MSALNLVKLPTTSIKLSPEEEQVFESLRRVFKHVALFGGCLREAFIRQNTPYSAPTRDIDARVSNPYTPMPSHLALAFSGLPLNQEVELHPLMAEDMQRWLGMPVLTVKNRSDRWSLGIAPNDAENNHAIDISFLKKPGSAENLKTSLFINASVAFSSVTYSDDGFIADKDFAHDATHMLFKISRHHGPRKMVWDMNYFGKLKEKYPELKLGNPEMPLLLAAQKLYEYWKHLRGQKPEDSPLTPILK